MAVSDAKELQDLSHLLCPPCYKTKTRMFGPRKSPNGNKPEDKFVLHKNYQQLARCTSCPLCQFICRELLYVNDADGRYRWDNPSSFAADAAITATVSWGTMVFENRKSYSSLLIEVGGSEVLKYDNPVHTLDASDRHRGQEGIKRPENRFVKARNWVHTCLEKHSECENQLKHNKQHFRPTRLLDVHGGENKKDVRLVLSEHLKINRQKDHKGADWRNDYVTLSYCWGTGFANSKTTAQNIGERLRNIPFESLPKTVQDAVKMTRKLGVNYLWVDALCIIQPTHNDTDDWSKEARMMGQVYRNSLCNIAACIGDNCEGGLFGWRDASELPTRRCMLAEGGNSERGFVLEPNVDHWYSNVELSSLSTRGWILQERLLAMRTIFCTADGLFWQCAQKSLSEFQNEVSTGWKSKTVSKDATPKLDDLAKTWRTSAKEFEFKATGKLTTKHISFARASIKHAQERQVEARPWHQLLYDFTRRNLTDAEDRLPAIQGVANYFAAATGDKYISNGGTWTSDLIGGMAWYRDWDHDSRRLLEAPSWSWASVTGHITSMYRRTGHVVNMAHVNWDKTLHVNDSTGSVSITELHIAGPACRIKLYRPAINGIFGAIDPADNPPPPPNLQQKFLIFKQQMPQENTSGVQKAPGIGDQIGWDGRGKHVQRNHYEVIFDTSEEEPMLGTEFLCMPLVCAGFELPTAQSFPMAVVLVPIDAQGKKYRRVGWCFMWADIPDSRVREVEVIIV